MHLIHHTIDLWIHPIEAIYDCHSSDWYSPFFDTVLLGEDGCLAKIVVVLHPVRQQTLVDASQKDNGGSTWILPPFISAIIWEYLVLVGNYVVRNSSLNF